MYINIFFYFRINNVFHSSKTCLYGHISFYFYDVTADREGLDEKEAAKKCLEEKNPSVTHALIVNRLWHF